MSAPVSTLSAAIITNLASSPLPDPSQAFRGYIKTQRRPPHHDPPLSSWCILPPLELPDDLPGCSMRPPNPLKHCPPVQAQVSGSKGRLGSHGRHRAGCVCRAFTSGDSSEAGSISCCWIETDSSPLPPASSSSVAMILVTPSIIFCTSSTSVKPSRHLFEMSHVAPPASLRWPRRLPKGEAGIIAARRVVSAAVSAAVTAADSLKEVGHRAVRAPGLAPRAAPPQGEAGRAVKRCSRKGACGLVGVDRLTV